MKTRYRHIASPKKVVMDKLGIDLAVDHIFPLSPSFMHWEFLSGCSLKRWLKKHPDTNFVEKMKDYVLKGRVFDQILTAELESRLTSVESPKFDEMEANAVAMVKKSRAEYWDIPENDDELVAWVDNMIGYSLAAMESKHFETIQPYAVQKQIWLNIGYGPQDIPQDGIYPADCRDWVTGFLDFVFTQPDGYVVGDFKFTSNPVGGKSASYKDGSVGSYKLQLMTYASALWQAGYDVKRVALYQFYYPEQRWHIVSEPFTMADYDRTIQVYRAARDHYLGVLAGTQDFIIPMNGSGKCSNYSCGLYYGGRCPFGAKV